MPKKILIVDDSTAHRQQVALALDGRGYELAQAPNTEQALRAITDNRPDLIVFGDLAQDNMNGFQLCGQIKKNLRHQSIKVVLLTARSQKSDIQEGMRVRADAYLIKPLNSAVLQKKVLELLNDGKPPAAPAPVKSSGQQQNSSSLDFSFPPRPSSLVNIQQEMGKNTPDLRYVAQQIAADITLSAALLQTVNSPFYGLRNKVSSVSDAVNLIGLTRTLHLVTAVSVRNSVPLPPGLDLFWDDTTKIAIMGASIAKHLTLDPNLAYLMGLFHDAAVPLMAAKHDNYLSSHLAFSNQEIEVSEAENSKYNMNHAMLGGLLARTWYLPAPLIEAIRLHHSLELFTMRLDFDVLNLVSVHLIADNIADQLKGNIDVHFPMLENKVREHLNLLNDTTYQVAFDKALDSINQP